MSKRTWVYVETEPGKVEAIEVSRDWSPTKTSEGRKSEEEVYGHITATDGTDLSTRKRHREYMQRNGLTIADDYKNAWSKAAEQRAEFYRTGGDSKARREAIRHAIYKLSKP